ncbi:acyltransferase family protein [Microbacterium dauci]|uniref:Acyltransferase family protein n=1 Tax=Microbacterium dauci TaxID=3048008 RepID=A0ABT6ZFI3_9MICO|nr:acyltransferase family protein [Microbacterium sp. LX3-4]MDJ1114495.1 acyltransferase family protein [Microbacterium sp. LX3-4]
MSAAPLATRPRTRGDLRPEIEGLRAVAVLAVLAYHLFPDALPGGFVGVDIFFVISGFLITSHLLRDAERTGRVSFVSFYSRRIMRLIPAATLVLVATAAATVLFVPRILWPQFGLDIIGAGTYSVNWLLAARSVDYLAEDAAGSPVQHYWSLGVEEQFYVIWPLLLAATFLLARTFRGSARRTALVVVAFVGAASLAYALYLTSIGDVSAYFVTTTRLWELAAGAAAAICIARVRTAPRAFRRVIVWVSALALIGSLLLVDGSSWPNAVTLVPILATTALLLWCDADAPGVVERVLMLRPAVWIGGISYAVYLWHWPMIVIAGYVLPSSWPVLVAIGAASIVAAWATSRWIETPLRFSQWFRVRPWRSFAFGATALLVSVACGAALMLAAPSNVLSPPQGATPAGAGALPAAVDLDAMTATDWLDGVEWAVPGPLDAVDDVPVIYDDGCQQDTVDAEVVTCEYGDASADRVMALVGDSKAAQWQPALDTIARDAGYRLVTYLKSSCAFADAQIERDGTEYTSCADWNANVRAALADERPDVVVTSQVRRDAFGGGDDATTRMADGIARTLGELVAAGSQVIVLGDTPQVGMNVYECVAEHPESLATCAYEREPAIEASALPAQREAVETLDGQVVDAGASASPPASPVTLVDLNGVICPAADACPPIVGNVLIYRSGSHITATYVESLTPRLQAILGAVLPASTPR